MQSNGLTRPASPQEWFVRAQTSLFPALIESFSVARQFQPQASDVFITPYMKCGTTWLQQIVHTLRTGGDMSFSDISAVIPWFEQAHAQGIDLNAPQAGQVRAFKSHMSWHEIPKGAKYLLALRDPKDALVSMYRFFDGWALEQGSTSIEDFATHFFLNGFAGDDYWRHLLSWWQVRDDPSVLLLSYEVMLRDPAKAIQQIAGFIDVELTPSLLATTLAHSSLAFMKQHHEKFAEHLSNELAVKVGFLPSGEGASKVQVGKVGGYQHLLSDSLISQLDARWRERVEPATGCATYAELMLQL